MFRPAFLADGVHGGGYVRADALSTLFNHTARPVQWNIEVGSQTHVRYARGESLGV